MPASFRGQFLIAARRLRDPNFFKTVVLMVEHGPQGAMGLVLNRPSPVTVAQALAGHFDLPANDNLVYVGGPVEPSALFILHNSAEVDASERPVVPGLFCGSSGAVFEHVVTSHAAGSTSISYRVICGCAGWAPGQLEGEISRGDWLLSPATLERSFCEDPYTLWENLLKELANQKPLAPRANDHPEWN